MGNHYKAYIPALIVVALLASVPISSCGSGASPPPSPTTTPPPAATHAPEPVEEAGPSVAFEITSAAFAPQASIPRLYTCDGEDISPPLSWSDPPEGTQSLALICDDPDAPVGTWVHWVLFNIPADKRFLPESVPAQDQLSDGSLHGRNSWRRRDYGGPCPPGGTHRYFFKLYALDTTLGLEAGATKQQVLSAMEGHILAQTELVGTYNR
jgi:Raf kinase inhibitor-like YbhB/YbcL family protein